MLLVIDMNSDKITREHVVSVLKGHHAHMTLDDAVKDFPISKINTNFPNGKYSSWQLLEHIRISQWDILDFTTNPKYKERKWPEGYWPTGNKKATKKDWDNTLAQIAKDSKTLSKLIMNPKTDIYAKIPHGKGQTPLREILLVVDHNSYHIGELAIIRQVMKTWGKRSHSE
jgi:hypothetical protein